MHKSKQSRPSFHQLGGGCLLIRGCQSLTALAESPNYARKLRAAALCCFWRLRELDD